MTVAPDYGDLIARLEATAYLSGPRPQAELRTEAAAAIRNLVAEREGLREALEPFAAIGLDYPTGGLAADLHHRAPLLMRRLEASHFYRAAKAFRKARAPSGRGKA